MTLKTQNIYCCLVCGKYFQGRGAHTPCHTHSVQCSHYVFINLDNSRIYCIPDNYEVIDASLEDIKFNLKPSFDAEELKNMGKVKKYHKDIFGAHYLPGFVGMNEICETDFMNVTIFALAHVDEIRSFLLANTAASSSSVLLKALSDLFRNLWSHKKFKSSVNPHRFVHTLCSLSAKRFDINRREDVKKFLIYLINEMNLTLKSSKQKHLVHSLFQGKLEIQSRSKKYLSVKKSPFMMLSLDLPEFPLFNDKANTVDFNQSMLLSVNRDKMTLIPEVDLVELLQKYQLQRNQNPESEIPSNVVVENGKVIRKSYKLLKAPKYLFLHINRFVKNNW